MAEGVRKGYLPAAKIAIAKKGYDGLVKQFIKEENGQTNLHGTVKVSGLGGKPYRDGSFEYYMSEPVIVNDPKGIGAFLLASNEMEILPTLPYAKGKERLLDRWFNSEKEKTSPVPNNTGIMYGTKEVIPVFTHSEKYLKNTELPSLHLMWHQPLPDSTVLLFTSSWIRIPYLHHHRSRCAGLALWKGKKVKR